MQIYKNAKIYTSAGDGTAEVLVTDGRDIIYVGDSKGAEEYMAGADCGCGCSRHADVQVHDLAGKTILPGIIDSHIHPGACAESTWHVRLPWTEDADELLAFVKQYTEEHPKEEMPFIYFEYYPTSMFDEDGPNKAMLDAVVSDRPVLCQDFGEHLCWVNSKMLELMGVDKNTPDPSKLEIFVRDENGEPTGWIKELAWRHFIDNVYDAVGWRPPEELTEDTMKPFFDLMRESGITALFDALIETDRQIRTVYEMDKAGKLHLYYDAAVRFWSYEDLPEKITKLREYQKLSGDFFPENIQKFCGYYDVEETNEKLIQTIIGHKKKMICINDSNHEIDFEKAKKEINNALDQILPEKSEFERKL